ncbi:unnamed protein product [Strongylus vulgaris]|uniref:ABC transmembrane type-1 domain-containing protein n=1 Tax=Strongylus vulgaris TaxID=40348 RepID=A0A3P7KRP0_STRVU|nr:unnamed protein product [Strongylus vulgaris]
MNIVHYSLLFFVAVDLPCTILLFGFYSSSWLFHVDLIPKMFAYSGYTSTPLDFVIMAILRALLLATLSIYLRVSDRIANLKMPSLGVATAIYCHTLVKLLCFSEHPVLLTYPGVWMTVGWSVLAAVMFLMLCWQLTAPRLSGYGRLEEVEQSSGEESKLRESTWRLTKLLFGYARQQWKWFGAGMIFLTLYALSRVFIPSFTGQVLAEIAAGAGMRALIRSVALMSLLALSR